MRSCQQIAGCHRRALIGTIISPLVQPVTALNDWKKKEKKCMCVCGGVGVGWWWWSAVVLQELPDSVLIQFCVATDRQHDVSRVCPIVVEALDITLVRGGRRIVSVSLQIPPLSTLWSQQFTWLDELSSLWASISIYIYMLMHKAWHALSILSLSVSVTLVLSSLIM